MLSKKKKQILNEDYLHAKNRDFAVRSYATDFYQWGHNKILFKFMRNVGIDPRLILNIIYSTPIKMDRNETLVNNYNGSGIDDSDDDPNGIKFNVEIVSDEYTAMNDNSDYYWFNKNNPEFKTNCDDISFKSQSDKLSEQCMG